MNFYVAGKWEERAEIRKLQNKLRELGHIITFDWTGDDQITREDFPIGNTLDDVDGVCESDAYVGRFINPNTYKGALVEWGVALACGIKIYIIGHAIDSCLFVGHPLVKQFDNEDEFLSYVSDINKRRGKWLDKKK